MEKELISIIVPVCQVKEYLEECINSLINQTYGNIEILLIDDGSTDGSGEICDKYARKDKRIRVVHQENKGLSAARNTGLNNAKGKYIAFVDSDDVVKVSYIEVLYSLIVAYSADIAVCDYIKSKQCSQDMVAAPDVAASRVTYAITSQEMLKQWHGKRKRIETVAWNKLYKRKVLIYFPESKKHEDVYTSHLFVHKADKIAITNEKLYLYRQRRDSITGSKPTRESIQQDLEAQKTRMDFFRNEKMYGSFCRCLLGHLMHRSVYFIK